MSKIAVTITSVQSAGAEQFTSPKRRHASVVGLSIFKLLCD